MSAYFIVPDVKKLDFSSVVSPSGWPMDRGWSETEPLTTSGVDHTRWRERRKVYHDWEAETISGFTSQALAVAEARQYIAVSGRIGTLNVTIAGQSYTWSKVHAELVGWSVNAGQIVGAAVAANATHQVRASWRFTLTQFSVAP
jgi:hypothetical protein